MRTSARMLSLALLFAFLLSFVYFADPASAYSNIGMSLSEQRVSTCPGDAETLVLALANNDAVTHTYFLSLGMPDGWKIPDNGFIPYCANCPDQQGITLASGESRNVAFWINPPAVAPGVYNVRVDAKAGVDEAFKDVEVEVLRCHDVAIEAPPAIDVCSDSGFRYSFSVANNGKYAEDFSVAVSGSWGAALHNESLRIDAGKKKDVSFDVASPQASGTVTVKAASVSSYAKGEVTTQVNVRKCYDFQARAEPAKVSSCLGTPAKFTLSIKNTGTAADTYSIQTPDWVALDQRNVTVSPGGETAIDLFASPASKGENPFDVVITSKGNAKIRASIAVAVEAEQCKSVAVIISPSRQEVCRGAQASFNVTVKNTGTVKDTYDLQTNAGVLGSNKASLNAGDVKDITLNIDTSKMEAGETLVTIVAKSGTVTDESSMQLAVKNCYSADFTVNPQNTGVCAGDEINYTITVKNTGGVADNYTFGLGGKDIGSASLEANESKMFSAKLSTRGLNEGVRNLTFSLTSAHISREVASSVLVKPEDSCYKIEISSEGPVSMVDPGKGIAIAVMIKNGGEKPDDYVLDLQGPAWVHLSQSSLSLGPGEEASVYIYASPGYDIAKDRYNAMIKVNSANARPQNFTFRIGVGVMPEGGAGNVSGIPTGAIIGLKGNTGKVVLLALIVLLILIILAVKFVLFVR